MIRQAWYTTGGSLAPITDSIECAVPKSQHELGGRLTSTVCVILSTYKLGGGTGKNGGVQAGGEIHTNCSNAAMLKAMTDQWSKSCLDSLYCCGDEPAMSPDSRSSCISPLSYAHRIMERPFHFHNDSGIHSVSASMPPCPYARARVTWACHMVRHVCVYKRDAA